MSSSSTNTSQQNTSPTWLQHVKDHYAALASVPVYIDASISSGLLENALEIQTTLLQRDIQRQTKRSISVSLTALRQNDQVNVLAASPAVDLGDAVMQATAPMSKRTAILRNCENKDSKTRRFVEVWDAGALLLHIEVTDKHDEFYTDPTFGALVWSRDEKQLVYIAERLPKDDDSKFDYVQTWGEKFGKKAWPTLVLVDIEAETAKLIDFGEHTWAPCQPIFSADGKELYFTAYETWPRRYGIRACQNRPAGIFKSRIDGTSVERISDVHTSSRSPRLTPDGSAIVFLANELGGAHASCAALVKYTIATGERVNLVPIVEEPKDPQTDFHGFFLENLPRRCWITTGQDDKVYLVTHTEWRSRRTIVAVDLTTGRVENLTPGANRGLIKAWDEIELKDDWILIEWADHNDGNLCNTNVGLLPQGTSGPSWTVLDAVDDLLVAARTAPNHVNDLRLGMLTRGEHGQLQLAWKELHQPALGKAAKLLENIDYEVIAFPERHRALETVLVRPAKHVKQNGTVVGGEKPPLIVYPHGGPHGAYATEYSPYVASLVSLGFAVSLVNYTGSTGFGNRAIKELIGKIGTLEVEDTQYTAEKLHALGDFDKTRVCLTGGSHGGFTAAHLIGRYPDYYRACVMRNPVINIGAMAGSTDIPDWCFAEAGISYNFAGPTAITPKDYSTVYAMSPISVIDKVRTPTLMMLGDSDQRVPPSEGLSWVHIARGLGKAKVGCKMYPKNGHALDSVEAEVAGFHALAGWFLEHINTQGACQT